MKQEQIFEVMTHIDPALVEQADLPRKRRRLSPLRTGLIAACLCVALVGTALAAAETFFGVRIIPVTRGEDRVGFDVFLDDIQYFPVDSLSQELLEMPKGETADFPRIEDAEEMLGVELSGFALFANRTGRDEIHYSIGDGPIHHTHCYVAKFESKEGRLAWVRVGAQYVTFPPNIGLTRDTRVNLLVSAMLYTEEYTREVNAFLYGWNSDAELTLGSFTTPDGREFSTVHAAYTVRRLDSEGTEQGTEDISRYFLYFVQDGILYEVEARGNGLDEETLHATLEYILGVS